MRGVVKWFNNDKGYGFLKTTDGEDVFVHHTSIVGTGYRTLNEAEPVEFDVKQGERGLQAESVRRISGEEEEEKPGVAGGLDDVVAITLVGGIVRLVNLTPDGAVQYLDPHKHLHGILYVAGRETAAYQQAIEEFEEIINSPNALELDLQEFFERNPEFLLRDEHRTAVPHVVLEREETAGPLIPDFVLTPLQPHGLSDLLELKRPNAKLFVMKSNRVRYSAALLEACAQLREYSEFFESTSNRQRVQDKYGLLAYRPRLFVLIGRQGTVDPIITRRASADLATPLVVDTYDDVLARAQNRLRKMKDSGSGWLTSR